MVKKRNTDREKTIFGTYQLFVWVWILGAITLTLYLIVEIITQNDPIGNFYLFGILAGFTGAIWGIGMNESLTYWKQIKPKNYKWFSREVYRKTLHKWILMGVLSLLYVFFASFFVYLMNL